MNKPHIKSSKNTFFHMPLQEKKKKKSTSVLQATEQSLYFPKTWLFQSVTSILD